MEGGREVWREVWREVGRYGRMEGWMEGGKEGGMEGLREGGRYLPISSNIIVVAIDFRLTFTSTFWKSTNIWRNTIWDMKYDVERVRGEIEDLVEDEEVINVIYVGLKEDTKLEEEEEIGKNKIKIII